MITRISSLAHLDDRPVFEGERVATEAWSTGGHAAEAQAREEYVASQAAKDQTAFAKFQQWRADIRAERVAALHALNAERAQQGLAPLDALPSKSNVRYEQVTPTKLDKAVAEIERVGKQQGQVSDAALAGALAELTAIPGADVAGTTPLQPGVAAVRAAELPARPPVVPTAEPVSAPAAVQQTAAAPPSMPEDTAASKNPRWAERLRRADAEAPGAAPSAVAKSVAMQQARWSQSSAHTSSSGTQDWWYPALDAALRKSLRRTMFDFDATAKRLSGGLSRGAIAAPTGAGPGAVQFLVSQLTPEAAKLRWAALSSGAAPAPAQPAAQAPPQPPQTSDHASVPGPALPAEAVLAPPVAPEESISASPLPTTGVAPIERLVQGEFKLTQFFDFVKVSGPLPSVADMSADSDDEESGSAPDEAQGSPPAVVAPLTRESILALFQQSGVPRAAAVATPDGSASPAQAAGTDMDELD